MSKPYSTYEVKTKFSAILRAVREGKTITVSYRGEPVAEIRPLGGGDRKLAQRLRRMADRGVLHRPGAAAVAPAVVKKRPGALRRFLADRDE
jgi:prevent-host-death family protein